MVAILRQGKEQLRLRGESDHGDSVAAVLLERIGQLAQAPDGQFAAARLLGVHAAAHVEDEDDVAPLAHLRIAIDAPVRSGGGQRNEQDAHHDTEMLPAAYARTQQETLAQ